MGGMGGRRGEFGIHQSIPSPPLPTLSWATSLAVAAFPAWPKVYHSAPALFPPSPSGFPLWWQLLPSSQNHKALQAAPYAAPARKFQHPFPKTLGLSHLPLFLQSQEWEQLPAVANLWVPSPSTGFSSCHTLATHLLY